MFLKYDFSFNFNHQINDKVQLLLIVKNIRPDSQTKRARVDQHTRKKKKTGRRFDDSRMQKKNYLL